MLTANTNAKQTIRDVRYDLLRICAALMVVVIHVSASNWYCVPYDSMEWAVMNGYDSFARSAVPIFFMLSGAFVLKKEIGIKSLWLKKILPLLIIYLVWSFLYAVDTIGIAQLTSTSGMDWVCLIVESKYHLWFLPALLGIYIIQPVLYAIVQCKEGKYIPYMIVIFIVFGIVKSTVGAFLGSYELLDSVLGILPVELVGYCGYVILGYYLSNINPIRMRPVFALVGYVITAFLATLIGQGYAFYMEDRSGVLYGYFTLPVFIEAIFLFLFFQNFNCKRDDSDRVKSCISRVATLTLGIYLLHPYFIDKLYSMGMHTLTIHPMIAIPVISVGIFVISMIISWVMSKIPVVKRCWTLS